MQPLPGIRLTPLLTSPLVLALLMRLVMVMDAATNITINAATTAGINIGNGTNSVSTHDNTIIVINHIHGINNPKYKGHNHYQHQCRH